MNASLWILGVAVASLTAMNTIFWGYAVREVGDPQPTIGFLLRLVLNKWFILAIASAFTASLLGYVVLREMGVIAGRFFLSLGAVAMVLVGTLVLGEKLTLKEWGGVALIMAGTILLGR
jgi:drug/metabolite transporter (DMT)-like permease